MTQECVLAAQCCAVHTPTRMLTIGSRTGMLPIVNYTQMSAHLTSCKLWHAVAPHSMSSMPFHVHSVMHDSRACAQVDN